MAVEVEVEGGIEEATRLALRAVMSAAWSVVSPLCEM